MRQSWPQMVSPIKSSGEDAKFSPLIVTLVPGGPSFGDNPVTFGGSAWNRRGPFVPDMIMDETIPGLVDHRITSTKSRWRRRISCYFDYETTPVMTIHFLVFVEEEDIILFVNHSFSLQSNSCWTSRWVSLHIMEDWSLQWKAKGVLLLLPIEGWE